MNNVKSVSLKDPIKLNIKSIKTNNYQNKIEQFNNYEEINYSDLNNDGKLDKNDVDVLSKATDDNFVGPLPQSFDFNGDNKINKDDVDYLNNFINQQDPNYSPEKERIKKKVDSITSFANSEYDKIKNSDFSYGYEKEETIVMNPVNKEEQKEENNNDNNESEE